MTGDSKPGDALADKARDEFDKNRRARELAIERLTIRAEMRSSSDEDENSSVIHIQAEKRLTEREGDSNPPNPTAWHVAILVVRKFPPWGSVLVALVVVALAAFVYLRTR